MLLFNKRKGSNKLCHTKNKYSIFTEEIILYRLANICIWQSYLYIVLFCDNYIVNIFYVHFNACKDDC